MPFSFRNLLQNQDNTCVSASSAAAVKNEYVLCKNRTQIRPRNESPIGEERICLRPVLFLLQGMNGIAGGLPIPGTAGNARMLPSASTRRTLVHAVDRLCGNACAAEAQTSECENAVWRYGRNTARGRMTARGRQECPPRDVFSRQGAFPQQYSVYCKGKERRIEETNPAGTDADHAAVIRGKVFVLRSHGESMAPAAQEYPSTRSHCRRDQRTHAAVALQPSSAAVSTVARQGRSLLAPKRFRTDPAISLWRQE